MRNVFGFATDADAIVQFLHSVDPDADIEIASGGQTWGVLTGDQLLFEGATKEECGDFLYGLIVGGMMFPHLAAHF